MGFGSGGQGRPFPNWIFIHDTNEVKGGLMKLFLALPWKFSAHALGYYRHI